MSCFVYGRLSKPRKKANPRPLTVANFLLKREVAAGALVVVDEAGQIGGRQMLDLLRLARKRNARVILCGDTRKHGAVKASDALLAIERHSGLKLSVKSAVSRSRTVLCQSQGIDPSRSTHGLYPRVAFWPKATGREGKHR